MDIELVDPRLQDATRRLRVPAVTNVVVRGVIRVAVRLMRIPKIDGVMVRTVRCGTYGLRIYCPEVGASGAGLLWIHGGGFVIGDARQDEALCAETAAELGIVVVSANYRLAPRHPFPAALDDLTSAWQWFQSHAPQMGVDPTRIAIGGESAGGGLAATLVQRLHGTAAVQPVAQWLFSPMLDDRTAADTTLDQIEHWIWNNAANRVGWTSYLGMRPGDSAVPDGAAAARRADLSGLPPTFISVGDIELFHDEDLTYAHRLRAADVDVTIDVVPGAPHGFENWARTTAPARRLVKDARTWLGAVLEQR